jgi:hypothetical protein
LYFIKKNKNKNKKVVQVRAMKMVDRARRENSQRNNSKSAWGGQNQCRAGLTSRDWCEMPLHKTVIWKNFKSEDDYYQQQQHSKQVEVLHHHHNIIIIHLYIIYNIYSIVF